MKTILLLLVYVVCVKAQILGPILASPSVATGGSAPTFVQSASGSAFSTTVSAVFGSSVTSGNKIIGMVGVDQGSVTFIVTDNCNAGGTSDTYTLADSAGGSGTGTTFYATAGTTGSCTVSATFSGSGSKGYVLAVHEITASILDVHVSSLDSFGNYNTTDSITSGNVTTTAANTYIFAASFDDQSRGSTLLAGTGYGLRVSIDPGGGGTGDNLFTEDRTLSATSTLAGTFTRSTTCSGNCRFVTGIMVFK